MNLPIMPLRALINYESITILIITAQHINYSPRRSLHCTGFITLYGFHYTVQVSLHCTGFITLYGFHFYSVRVSFDTVAGV